jgi:hypothetical protein
MNVSRRTIGFGGLLGLLLAGTLATSALAATFSFTTVRSNCQTSGGTYGFGYVRLKVRVQENGKSGANYFRVLGKAQYKNGSGWHTLINYGWNTSETFPNDTDSWYYIENHRFDPDGTPDALSHRIWMKVQVWSLNNGLLEERIMKNSCPTGI